MQTKPTVLVTGASGFIGAHCVIDLLNAGYAIRASVRSQKRINELSLLLNKHMPDAHVEYHILSLESDHGWEEALAGCQYVLHLASPLPIVQPKDPQDIIRPARDGALRVIKAAQKAGLQRIVMTSSQAAVCGSPMKQSDYVYTEADWTDINDPSVSPYNQSKTIAEREARDYVNKAGDIELVTVNPGLVCGPMLQPIVNTSLELIKRMLDGSLPFVPPLGYETSDVRDVAVLHRLAMENPNANGGRFMASSNFLWLHDMAKLLHEHFNERTSTIPRRQAPAWMLRMMSIFDPSIRTIVPDLNQHRRVDNSTSKRILGWQPRPAEEAVLATAESMFDFNIIT